jgi:hypothetical protein
MAMKPPSKPQAGNSGTLRREKPGTPDNRPITSPVRGFSYIDKPIAPQVAPTGGLSQFPPGHSHAVAPPKTRGTGKPPEGLDRAPNGTCNANGGLQDRLPANADNPIAPRN